MGAIDFGPLVRVSHPNVIERTFSAWVYPETRLDGTRTVISVHADTGGMLIFLSDAFGTPGNASLHLYSNRYSTSLGWWYSTTTAITLNSWWHVAATYNHTSTANNPSLYINGIPQAITEHTTPAGSLRSELGTHVVIGNVKTATVDYAWEFIGKIYDPRIYDRMIEASEVVTMYNGGTPDPSLVTDGMVFGGLAVLDGEATNYIDQTLGGTNNRFVFENMYRSRGTVIQSTPGGYPTGRAAP